MKQKTWAIVWENGGWVNLNKPGKRADGGMFAKCLCCGYDNLKVLHILINRGGEIV